MNLRGTGKFYAVGLAQPRFGIFKHTARVLAFTR